MANIWFEEWPKEPGNYWFYGYTSRWIKDPELHLVQVRLSGNILPVPMYITDGRFVYESDGAQGLWQPATLPELPILNKRQGEK